MIRLNEMSKHTEEKSNRALDDYLRFSAKSDKSKRRDVDVLELNLANKGITELKSLVRFKNLTRLWLQSNKIRHLPFIQNCDSLSEIYLQNNLIQSIEYCFRNLTNINTLYLNMNQLADLKSVANELSYLKYLKILNLYENPIALETEYRNLIIYSCSSLEIFDKNLLDISEREKIVKIYEPERIRLERRRAFLRTYHRNDSANTNSSSLNSPHDNNNNINNDKLLSKRTSLAASSNSFKIRSSLLSRKFSGGLNSRSSHLNRSIKEFSYFDWSKVRLYDNEHNFHLDNNNFSSSNANSSFNANNSTTTIETKSSYSTETNSQIKNINNNQNCKNSDLPQVITIRYT